MSTEIVKNKIDGDGVEFVVTPVEAPTRWGCLIFGCICASIALCGVFLAGENEAKSDLFNIIAVVFGFIGSRYLWRSIKDGRPKSHKVARKFRVYRDVIELPKKVINKDDIDRISISNGIRQQKASNGWMMVAVDGHAGTAVLGDTAQGIERDRAKKLSTICFSVEVESGGKAYILAGGIDEIMAYSILKDIGRIMGTNTTESVGG